VYAGLTDRCGMAMLLGKLPYNRNAAEPSGTCAAPVGGGTCAAVAEPAGGTCAAPIGPTVK
jgi:hypothetical protein